MRTQFNQYPIYLKHTLFHNEENMVKVRRMEISQRFFVYEQFREKGNKLFNKELYEDAIQCYELAASVFKWLELIDEDEEEFKIYQQQRENKNHQNKNKNSENINI